MTGEASDDSTRSEPTADREEAFGLLANETRLEIIRTLGDESGPDGYATLPYSELQAAVGVEDSGQFGYHLRKLEGRFVERTDRGYTLRLPGIQMYQAILAGTYSSDTTVEPTPVETACVECGEPYRCWYRDYRFHLGCPECDRVLFRYPLSPGTFERPDDLVRAGDQRIKRDIWSMQRKICPYCSGPVDVDLVDCVEGMPSEKVASEHVNAQWSCIRCHWFMRFTVGQPLVFHPAVVSFGAARGLDVVEQPLWAEGLEIDETVRSTDPLRIEVVVHRAGDELRLLVDENLDVVEVDDPDRPN